MQVSALIIILLAFVVSAIVRRRENAALRPIAAYSALPGLVDQGIEASRPLHLSFGSASLGANSTLLALASADLVYYAAQRASTSDTSPIITMSDTTSIPLGMDTLRRAYDSRGMISHYRPVNVRWYPDGPRSMAYAGGVMAMQADDRISANVLVGSHGLEIGLMIDAARRRSRAVIAGSDQLDGMALAYGLADYPIIGEEIFAAPAYLDSEGSAAKRSTAIDLLRWVMILGLSALTLVSILQEVRG